MSSRMRRRGSAAERLPEMPRRTARTRWSRSNGFSRWLKAPTLCACSASRVVGADHEYGEICSTESPQAAGDFLAMHLRHGHIEDHNVRDVGLGQPHRLEAVGRKVDGQPLGFECAADERPYVRVVVNDQNTAYGLGHRNNPQAWRASCVPGHKTGPRRDACGSRTPGGERPREIA